MRVRLRTTAVTARARTRRSASAPAEAPAKIPAKVQDPACQSTSAARPAATGRAASQGRRPTAGSTSARRSSDGRTLRTLRSGQSAQSSAVSMPIAKARASVPGSGRAATSIGRAPATSRTMAGWANVPRASPTAHPARATICVCNR